MSNFKKSEPCTCDECISYCKTRPGWFLPKEAEKVAKFLNLPIKELYKKYLVIDYWESDDLTSYILSPGSRKEHGRVASWGFAFYSQCIFLNKNNKCLIHPVKPFACAVSHHSKDLYGLSIMIARKWKKIDVFKLVGEK